MKKFVPSKYNLSVSGFTLAEVLITLAIIGVVAAMTIPGLILGVQKDQYVSKLKKEYSAISQAYNSIKADNGGSILGNPNFDCSGTCNTTASAAALNDLATYLKVAKNCGNSTGCWYASPIKYLGGTTNVSDNIESSWSSSGGKAILTDGTSIMVGINGSSCTTTFGSGPLAQSGCGTLHIDVNGTAGPNTSGRDFFSFWITQAGIYPIGIFGDGGLCSINSSDASTSYVCTAKVLKEGAMNY